MLKKAVLIFRNKCCLSPPKTYVPSSQYNMQTTTAVGLTYTHRKHDHGTVFVCYAVYVSLVLLPPPRFVIVKPLRRDTISNHCHGSTIVSQSPCILGKNKIMENSKPKEWKMFVTGIGWTWIVTNAKFVFFSNHSD